MAPPLYGVGLIKVIKTQSTQTKRSTVQLYTLVRGERPTARCVARVKPPLEQINLDRFLLAMLQLLYTFLTPGSVQPSDTWSPTTERRAPLEISENLFKRCRIWCDLLLFYARVLPPRSLPPSGIKARIKRYVRFTAEIYGSARTGKEISIGLICLLTPPIQSWHVLSYEQ